MSNVILRKCRNCGLEAKTLNELNLFKTHKGRPCDHENLCKKCYNEYMRNWEKNPPKPKPYLRKCRFCGLEAKTKEDLKLFAKSKRLPHGRDNICKNCYNRERRAEGKYYYKNPKPNILNTNNARIKFKGKTMLLDKNPRTNICQLCGRKYPDDLPTQTALHHTKYDTNDPLKHTIELCSSCHAKIHYMRKQNE